MWGVEGRGGDGVCGVGGAGGSGGYGGAGGDLGVEEGLVRDEDMGRL